MSYISSLLRFGLDFDTFIVFSDSETLSFVRAEQLGIVTSLNLLSNRLKDKMEQVLQN